MEKTDVLTLKSTLAPSMSPSLKEHRHKTESFCWFTHRWDITQLWSRIDGGELREGRGDFKRFQADAEFIRSYATRILGLKDEDRSLSREQIQEKSSRSTMMMSVDLIAAMDLPVDALKEPILFLETPKKGGGLLRMSGDAPEPAHVLGDGNHRVARAFLDGLDALPALILSRAVCNQALIGHDLGRAVRAKKSTQVKRPARAQP